MGETIYVSKWPGIERAPQEFLRKLIQGAIERGWDYDSLLGHISIESAGFQTDAKNPHGSASGLIQIIESEAKKLGTTTGAIRRMSFEQQLPYVFKYFDNYREAWGLPTLQGSDYRFLGYGKSPRLKEEAVLFEAPSREYEQNANAEDSNKDGKITAGEIRRNFEERARRAGEAGFYEVDMIPPPARGAGAGAVVLAASAFFAFTALLKKFRRRR